jgi:hypothetical protein
VLTGVRLQRCAELICEIDVDRHNPDTQCVRRRLGIAPLRWIGRTFHVD